MVVAVRTQWFEVAAAARSNFRPAAVAGTCAEGRVVVEAGRCHQLVLTPRYKAPCPVAGPDSRGSRQATHVAVVGSLAPGEAGRTGVEPAGSRSSWLPTRGCVEGKKELRYPTSIIINSILIIHSPRGRTKASPRDFQPLLYQSILCPRISVYSPYIGFSPSPI